MSPKRQNDTAIRKYDRGAAAGVDDQFFCASWDELDGPTGLDFGWANWGNLVKHYVSRSGQ
jgi:hypothetical protein